MSFQSRMGAMLRRQEAVRRTRDRYVIVGMVMLVIGGAIVIIQVRSEEAHLTWQLASAPVVFLLLWWAWRCLQVATGLSRLYTDPQRLAEMESLDELPTLHGTLLPFLK